MLKAVCLLSCFCALSREGTFENKVITTIRQAIEKNLDYIERNTEKINVDCLFGVALTTAILRDAFQNGTHVMDKSSLKLIGKSVEVMNKGKHIIENSKFWTKYILDYNIWKKNIKYKYNQLETRYPNLEVLGNIFKYQSFSSGKPSTDFCLQDIVNQTINKTVSDRKCHINRECWKKYYVNYNRSSGYTLTHELLLIQFAKARKCLINKVDYETKTKQLCELIYSEVFNGDYFDVLDDMFDLFLEEITLCGYEGYTNFFKRKWLFYILKSQKPSGCFPAALKDNLKTRIKRNINIFEDGCADHTTGLGLAVLSLHYNFIIKENIRNLK